LAFRVESLLAITAVRDWKPHPRPKGKKRKAGSSHYRQSKKVKNRYVMISATHQMVNRAQDKPAHKKTTSSILVNCSQPFS